MHLCIPVVNALHNPIRSLLKGLLDRSETNTSNNYFSAAILGRFCSPVLPRFLVITKSKSVQLPYG